MEDLLWHAASSRGCNAVHADCGQRVHACRRTLAPVGRRKLLDPVLLLAGATPVPLLGPMWICGSGCRQSWLRPVQLQLPVAAKRPCHVHGSVPGSHAASC